MSAAPQQASSMEDLQRQLADAMEALRISNERNAQLQEEGSILRADAERAARCSDYMFEQQARELRRTQEELEEERMRADEFEQRLRRVEEESDEEEEEGSQEEEERLDGAETEDESESEEESGSEEESSEEENRSEEEVVDRAAELDNIRAFAVGRWQGGVRVHNLLNDLESRLIAARYN